MYLLWLENPYENKTNPKVKKISVISASKASYRLDVNKMKLKILGYETTVLRYSSTLTQCKDYKIAEAKLVKRGKE